RFMKHRLTTLISLRHKNGNYIYLKQTMFVFQHDHNNCLLEYLNHFTVLKDHESETYNIRPTDDIGSEIAAWVVQVRKAVSQAMLGNGLFSDFQKVILGQAAINLAQPVCIAAIATGIGE